MYLPKSSHEEGWYLVSYARNEYIRGVKLGVKSSIIYFKFLLS